ncbi:MAG: flagellin, partial [Pseudomonadota bacterium]
MPATLAMHLFRQNGGSPAAAGNPASQRQFSRRENRARSPREDDMSSILTNTSAMVALQTLNMTNKNLDMVQNQISTGKKVATA